MKTARIKAAPSTIINRSEMETVVGQIAAMVSGKQKLEAELNAQITALRAQYDPALAEQQKTIDEKTALARDWAEANPGEFGALRSITFRHGTVGWRLGNPTLQLLHKKQWSWDKVLAAIQSLRKTKYIRTLAPEVNKQAILDDRDILKPEGLASLGVKVGQSDSFYIEPAVIETATRVEGATP